MDAQVKKLETLLSENALEIEDFANCLGISDKQAEAFCEGKKKLTSALARQIEQTFSKPKFWLDFETVGDEEGPQNDLFG
jgi:plasmid maintenance system antidote protein VapI